MRSLLAGCALLLLAGATAQAQPYYGEDDDRPPPPRHRYYHPDDDGYDRPRPHYGEYHHRHCRMVFDEDGPRRICHDRDEGDEY